MELKNRLDRVIEDHPLLVILLIGWFLFLVSGGTTFYWASSQSSRPTSVSSTPSSNDASQEVSREAQVDTGSLSASNWESFVDYQGERREMLGIKRTYSVVNFRTGPSTDYRITETPSGGTLLIPLDRFQRRYRARSPDGTIGWIHQSLVRILKVPRPVFDEINRNMPPLQESTEALIPRSFFQHNRVKVTVSVVNLRRGPGTQFDVVSRAYRYQQLRLLARRRNWYRVQTANDLNVWVTARLVEPVWLKPPSKQRVLTVENVAIRLGPRYQFREEYVISEPTKVRELEVVAPWHMIQVEDGETIGWILEKEVR